MRRYSLELFFFPTLLSPIVHYQPRELCRGRLLESCVLESMRLYPPAYLIGRCNADEPTVLGGFSIPRKTTGRWITSHSFVFETGSTISIYLYTCVCAVLISPYLLHRQPSHWQDSESFIPERWVSSPRSLSYENPHYAPFGLGPRSCVGMGFALLESSLVSLFFFPFFFFRCGPKRQREERIHPSLPPSFSFLFFVLLQVVALFVLRFDSSLVDGSFPKAGPTITLRPKKGVRMDLKPVRPLVLHTASTPRAMQTDR